MKKKLREKYHQEQIGKNLKCRERYHHVILFYEYNISIFKFI
jgi:hypothetical protein